MSNFFYLLLYLVAASTPILAEPFSCPDAFTIEREGLFSSDLNIKFNRDQIYTLVFTASTDDYYTFNYDLKDNENRLIARAKVHREIKLLPELFIDLVDANDESLGSLLAKGVYETYGAILWSKFEIVASSGEVVGTISHNFWKTIWTFYEAETNNTLATFIKSHPLSMTFAVKIRKPMLDPRVIMLFGCVDFL